MDFFPKRLLHGFCLKFAIFPTFFLGNIGEFYDILEQKNAVLGYTKKKKFKFKPIFSIVLVQNGFFLHVLVFRQSRPGEYVSSVGVHMSLGICFFYVGEHISLGICVSLVGEHILIGICV